MLDLICKFFFSLVNLVNNLTIGLATSVLSVIFPSFGNLISNITYFFNTYVWNIVIFIKKIFVNFLCFPQELFTLCITIFMAFISVTATCRLILGVLNVISLIKNGRTAGLGSLTDERFDDSIHTWRMG